MNLFFEHEVKYILNSNIQYKLFLNSEYEIQGSS